tara:strand:- start:209202 stop:209840 length:639 start_codon:yes stop_codon:yes gene_type:complete
MAPALSIQSSPPERDPAELASVIARAANGEEEAWRELLALYSRRVFAMARSRLHNDDLAEEITQSVFVTIATKLNGQGDSGGYSEQGKFEPWLFRITMNRVRDYCRKRARHATPTAPEHMGGLSAKPELDHAQRDAGMAEMTKLRSAMEQLSERDREIIELRHHGQLSFKQIAEISGDPIGTLLARHHRALKKLREILEPQHPPQDGSGEVL